MSSIGMRTGAWLVLLVCGCGGVLSGVALEFTELVRRPLKGLVVPVYQEGSPAPVATIRIERLSTGLQRRGFFRIGLLPMVLAEGVVVEVAGDLPALRTLGRVQASLSESLPGKALELRRCLVRLGQTGGRLEAGRVTFAENRSWHLSDGVKWEESGRTTTAKRGTLTFQGGHEGKLMLEPAAFPAAASDSVPSARSSRPTGPRAPMLVISPIVPWRGAGKTP